jgi:hypothetical protein
MAEVDDEYQAGLAAARAGQLRTANPHDGRSRQGRSWMAGWDAGRPAQPDVGDAAAEPPEGEQTMRGKQVDLYQAKESFVTMLEGEQVAVARGDLVRAGHPLLKGRDELFKPAEGYIRFDVEQATSAPGERRGDTRGGI